MTVVAIINPAATMSCLGFAFDCDHSRLLSLVMPCAGEASSGARPQRRPFAIGCESSPDVATGLGESLIAG